MKYRNYITLRRELHRHPEPAWCEFYTTSRIITELRSRNLDEIYIGTQALATDHQCGVPDGEKLSTWIERALKAGADPSLVDYLKGGKTGCVAVLKCGAGPVVGLRVDIDGLPIEEANHGNHTPVSEGFRSQVDGYMHACGHDAHVAIGLGVLDKIADSGFNGTLKLFFQPAEEGSAGGKPMANSGLLDDVEYLFAIHVGLDYRTGVVVAGFDDFLAVEEFLVEFTGASSHAGSHPETGQNAVQAMATAINNLYSIPRNGEGKTRINVGRVNGATTSNVIPKSAFMSCEVRGETTGIRDYMIDHAYRICRTASEMYGCNINIENQGRVPDCESDPKLAELVGDVATELESINNVIYRDSFGASEDAAFLMRNVQHSGGYATYVGIGTDHPSGHHTSGFDIDERSIVIGIDVLSQAIERVGE